VETFFPWCGKTAKKFSIVWKKRTVFSIVWKKVFHSVEKPGEGSMRKLKLNGIAAALAFVLLATPGFGVPTIVHDPIRMAEKNTPLGVKATVRDAAARVETVSLFYAASRGMTPFRAGMSSSGAGVWYATIPGHMMGPGAQMFYYIQAENADGETRETEWQTVKLVEAGVAPEAIPSATSVAQQAQRQAVPARTGTPATAPQAKTGKSKYLIPAAIIVGGAVAVGGAMAIAANNGGGGGGGGGIVTNANYGGSYDICFTPTSMSNSAPVCDSGLVNVYVREGSVEIVGLWGAEVLAGTLNGSVFSAVKEVAATPKFPAARLIVSGEIVGDSCDARVDGFSTDPLSPGNIDGRLDTTKR
jgi:hypothetical protein